MALPMASWTPARKSAAGLFAFVVFCGLACAAIYLSAVIFLLLNKVHPRHAGFMSIATYWDAYADDPRRNWYSAPPCRFR
jgi:type IV secretion system protein VirD4